VKDMTMHKKINLLELQSSERNQLIKEIKEKLRIKITEAKLWHSLLEVENIIVNGNLVYTGSEQLSGFSILR
jgi:hypothetical protein